MGQLDGKVALITGGASGLGEAEARRFVAEGAQVVIGDVNVERGQSLAKEIGAEFKLLDVRSEQAIKSVIDGMVSRYGKLDVLVNNAGIARPGTPETISEDDYRMVMAVCIDGVVFGCKHALPAMSASGGGSIINIASTASIQGVPFAAGYSAAKGAVESYTRSVAVHCRLSGLNIRCNSVHPGGFATPMIGKTAADLAATDAASSERFNNRATKKLGDPVEVGNLVVFLASDQSSWINGQRFVIDNGETVTMLSAG